MRELEKHLRGKNVGVAVICFIIGLAIFLFFCKDYIPVGNVQNLDAMNPADVKEGRAEITVYDVYDYFTYWTDASGKEKKRDYFVAIGEGDSFAYIGLELSGKNNDRAYDIMQKLWTMDEAGEDVDLATLDHFKVKGKVRKMSGDVRRYYDEYLEGLIDYYGMSKEDAEAFFVPYILVPATIGEGGSRDYLVVIVAVILLVAGIGLLANALFGNPIKEIDEYCKKSIDPDGERVRIERFYISTPEQYEIRVNDDYFLFTGGSKAVFCETKDVLWFYKVVEKTSVNYIPTGKNYYVRFRLANGKQVQVSATKKNVDELITYFMKLLPDSIVGFDDSRERIFTRDRIQMINEVKRRRGERLGTFDRNESSVAGSQSIVESNDQPNTTPDLMMDGMTDSFEEVKADNQSENATGNQSENAVGNQSENAVGNQSENAADEQIEEKRDPMDLHLNFTRDDDSENTIV